MTRQRVLRFTRHVFSIAGLLFCAGGAELALGTQPFSLYLDRSYYTSELTATVVCRMDEPAAKPAGKQIVVKVDGYGRLAGNAECRDGVRITIPISELSVGQHAITVAVLDESEQPVVSRELSLVKRPPKPGCEWKIDQINMVVLRNGEPFFPHGILMSGSESDFAEAAKLGFQHASHLVFSETPRACDRIRGVGCPV